MGLMNLGNGMLTLWVPHKTTCSLVCLRLVCVHSNRKGTNTFWVPMSPGMLSPGLPYGQAYTALKANLSSRGQQELPNHWDVI